MVVVVVLTVHASAAFDTFDDNIFEEGLQTQLQPSLLTRPP